MQTLLHIDEFNRLLKPRRAAATWMWRIAWLMSNVSAIPLQLAAADDLAQGGYDRHLRRVREALATLQPHALKLVERTSRPVPASPGPKAATSYGWRDSRHVLRSGHGSRTCSANGRPACGHTSSRNPSNSALKAGGLSRCTPWPLSATSAWRARGR